MRNTIVWHKPNIMPQSVKDRFTVDFEYVFFFAKSTRYYFEQQLEPHKESSLQRYRYSLEGSHIPGYVYPNERRGQPHAWKLNTSGRNKRCVWTVSTKGFSGAHYAVFPEALVEPMVRAGCPPRGLVLDPFLGSGTTAVVARKLARNFIGIELNPEYSGMALERLKPYLEQKSFHDFNPV
ncbi:site-specific DNA-methyltransferase [Candidatus Acetothermia bacterium]|nr:site-specific DNA-methyltransferase [Candidatus Acetothermia bacterium]